jgi:hypothetical protein
VPFHDVRSFFEITIDKSSKNIVLQVRNKDFNQVANLLNVTLTFGGDNYA